MKKFILIVVHLLVSTSAISFAQKVTNWQGEAHFHYLTNYDFDTNQPMGPAVRSKTTIKIDINYGGTGKIYFLDNSANGGYGQKLVYTIDYASYRNYTNGGQFIEIKAHNEYAEFTFRVDIKTRRHKQRIIKIAQVNKDNEGSLNY